MRFLLLALGACLACTAEQPPTAPDISSRRPVQSNDAGSKSSTSPKLDNSDPGSNVDESDLPAYLFKRSEVEAISALVKSYQKPSSPNREIPNTTSEYPREKAIVEKYFRGVMSLSDMKPGRDLKVHMIKADDSNAWADGHQNVGVHAGMLRSSEFVILSTLCHEVAHSTYNHAVSNEVAESALYAEFDPLIEELISKYYDRNTKKWKHPRAEYLELKRRWDEKSEQVSLTRRRGESEADIVGAMICAVSGMSPDDYIQGYDEFRRETEQQQQSQDSSPPESIPDGAEIPLDSEEAFSDFMFYYLFGMPTHPPESERVEQLTRVRDIIGARYEPSQSYADDFSSEIKRSSGLTLADGGAGDAHTHHVTKIQLPSGEVIHIQKPVRGCSHVHGPRNVSVPNFQ